MDTETQLYPKCELYQDSICADEGVSKFVLPNYPAIQQALNAREPDVLVNCTSAIPKISESIEFLSSLVGQQCADEGLPFLCDYFLPTCVNNTNVRYPTEQQCNYVKNGPCKTEWSIASNLPNLKPILPDCSLIQHHSHSKPNNAASTIVPTDLNNSSSSKQHMFECHPLFILKNCICLPSCSTFRMNTEAGQVMEDIAISITLIVYILSGIIYFIFFIARLKVM